MDVLIVTDVPFWKKSNGSQMRIASLTSNIDKNFKTGIYFIGSENPSNDLFKFKRFSKISIRKNIINHLKKSSFLKKLRNRYIREKVLSDYYNKEIIDDLAKYIKKNRPKVVIFEYIHLSYLLESVSDEKIIKVIDTHDIQSERYKEFNKNKLKGCLKITLEEESEILSKYDLVLTINNRDKDILKKNVNAKIITTLYPGEVEKIDYKGHSKKLNIGFIGGAAEPNIQGINKFIKEVYINLDKNLNIELNIYGSVCNFLNKELIKKGVNIHGFVENIKTPYIENNLMINPMNLGSGLKIKTMEALCYGKCMLTTSVGAQGLENFESAYIKKDSSKEQKGIIEYLAKNIGVILDMEQKSFEIAKRFFSEEVVYDELINSIKERFKTEE